MNKQAFLAQLRKKLSGLPHNDLEEHLAFYSEMIEDRMEEGLPEEKAVAAIGTVDKIASQIIADTPFSNIAKARLKPTRQLVAWEVVLLILGAPIWLSLAVSAASVILSIYVSLWAVIISLWSVFCSLVGCALGGIVAGVMFICRGYILSGIAVVGAGIICAGLSVFMFYGCKAATKGILILTKKSTAWIKHLFMKKGGSI